jgi:hypothetical protein
MDDRPDSISGRTEDDELPRVFKIAKLGGRRGFVETIAKGVAASTAAVAAGTCGGGSGTGPSNSTSSRTSSTTTTTTTAPTAWTLHGYVIDDSNGRPVAGATVTIMDGPNRNRSTVTDSNGYYSLANLTQSGFTIQICAPEYDCYSRGVTLTSTLQVDIRLTPRPTTTTTRRQTTPCSCDPEGGCGCNPVHYWWPC